MNSWKWTRRLCSTGAASKNRSISSVLPRPTGAVDVEPARRLGRPGADQPPERAGAPPRPIAVERAGEPVEPRGQRRLRRIGLDPPLGDQRLVARERPTLHAPSPAARRRSKARVGRRRAVIDRSLAARQGKLRLRRRTAFCLFARRKSKGRAPSDVGAAVGRASCLSPDALNERVYKKRPSPPQAAGETSAAIFSPSSRSASASS